MNRRAQARLRLEKISEASSPSPKRQQTTEELSNSRLIPFASSTIRPSPKKMPSMNEQRNSDLNLLRQQIMDRRQRLTLWEQTFLSRQNSKVSTKQLLVRLAKGLTKLAEHPDIKFGYLKAVKRGRKGLLLWLLGWLSAVFTMLRTVLAQRNLVKF